MRALITNGTDAALAESHPDPTPKPGEALVRVTAALALAPDAAIASSGSFTGVLGQAFVGEVESVGSREDAELIGTRATAAADIPCGVCELCKRGLSAHCPHMQILGRQGRDGAFAELIAVPVKSLIKVPSSVTDEAAVFGRPLAAALHASGVVRLDGKGFVTVLGDGVAALLCAQAMSRRNATVRLLASQPQTLALAEKLGVKHRALHDAGRRQDQDVVIECTGAAESFATATEMVRPRGSLVLVPVQETADGAVAGRRSADLSAVVRDELNLIGARTGSLREAMHELEIGSYDPTPLIARRLRLSDGVGVLNAASEPGQLGVLVTL
ncbi:MAG: alcohol dehydrogenase catalytic domain-containing protein [Planctomycetota bacterium]